MPSASASATSPAIPTRPIVFQSVIYGPCAPASRPSCPPTLEIQSWPECRRNETSYSRSPTDLALNQATTLKLPAAPLLPAVSFDHGSRIELYSGTTTTVVFADRAVDALRAAETLVQLNKSLSTVPDNALQAAQDPSLPCKGRSSGSGNAALVSHGAGVLQSTYTQSGEEPSPSASCPASRAIDPINVVWYGRHARATRVADALATWGGWIANDLDLGPFIDHQYAEAQAACLREAEQRASSCAFCNRDHVRLFELTRGSDHFVVGDAHHDQNVFFEGSCTLSHISSTFTEPRDRIAQFSRARVLGARLAYWGNTRRLRQCDGSTPHSDGYVLEEGV